jgi:hypothetical protein
MPAMTLWFKRPSAEERVAKRKRVLVRGMGLFILIYGILYFGAFTFLIDLGVSILFQHRHIDFGFLIAKPIQWTIAGLIYGAILWRVEYGSDEDAG